MKLNKIIALGLLLSTVSIKVLGQCNIHREKASDTLTFYKASKERIFQNEDLERGIQNVFASMACMTGDIKLLPQDRKLKFSWWLIIDSGADTYKPKVVPRKVTIEFSDYSRLELATKFLEDPRRVYSVTMQEGYIKLTNDEFEMIKGKDISRITVIDTRENTSIICRPYKGILKEQSNCIADEVEY